MYNSEALSTRKPEHFWKDRFFLGTVGDMSVKCLSMSGYVYKCPCG